MKLLFFRLALCAITLAASACTVTNAPLNPQTAISSGALSPAQSKYDVKHYALEIEVRPDDKFILGKVSMQAQALDTLTQIELDLDPRFDVMAARINGMDANHRTQEGKLLLSAAPITAGSTFTTTVSYQGKPYEAENPPWDGGFVWTQTPTGEHWIATAVQGRGCDLYWPCKDHISDKPEKGADISITVPQGLVAVMNGNLLSENTSGGKTTYHWKTTNPISSYHLAINIGPFQKYQLEHQSVLAGTSSFPIVYYHITDDEEKIERLIRDDFAKQLAYFERTLGPYPWGNEKIGIVQIPYLGMEHQTMNGYGNEYTLDPHGFDWLMQHEFSHEWFGNLMTQTASRDFWLHEGFASYMQATYAQEVIGDAGYWSHMWDRYTNIENCQAVVPPGPVSQDYFDSNDPYFKGAWMLHTLRWLIGEDTFWRSVRRLIYDTTDPWSLTYPIAPTRRSTEDFERIISEESGRDLAGFVASYLKQTDMPKLLQERTDKGLRLQWQNAPLLNFPIPVQISVGGDTRLELIPVDGTLFSVSPDAIVQVDPQTKVLRNFGTTLPCDNYAL